MCFRHSQQHIHGLTNDLASSAGPAPILRAGHAVRSLPFVPEQGVVCDEANDIDARDSAIMKSASGKLTGRMPTNFGMVLSQLLWPNGQQLRWAFGQLS